MSDLISREEVLNLIDTAFESGAFDGRYAYENLIDAVQNLIHPLETDLISRQAAKLKVARVIWKDGDSCNDFHDKCVDCLDDLPSVEPEYGKLMKYNVGGHDACKCSKCNTDLGYPYEGKFCKWCGAKMMEVDE